MAKKNVQVKAWRVDHRLGFVDEAHFVCMHVVENGIPIVTGGPVWILPQEIAERLFTKTVVDSIPMAPGHAFVRFAMEVENASER